MAIVFTTANEMYDREYYDVETLTAMMNLLYEAADLDFEEFDVNDMWFSVNAAYALDTYRPLGDPENLNYDLSEILSGVAMNAMRELAGTGSLDKETLTKKLRGALFFYVYSATIRKRQTFGVAMEKDIAAIIIGREGCEELYLVQVHEMAQKIIDEAMIVDEEKCLVFFNEKKAKDIIMQEYNTKNVAMLRPHED